MSQSKRQTIRHISKRYKHTVYKFHADMSGKIKTHLLNGALYFCVFADGKDEFIKSLQPDVGLKSTL